MGVWLRDLPAALAGWGFQVTEVPGWQTRGHGPLLRSPRGIVDHWTATAQRRADDVFPTAGLVTNGRSDLAGPLANLMLGFDGQPKIVAAGLAYHAGTGNRGVPCSGNSDMIGIECEGAGAWTDAQLRNYPRLCAALWHWYSDVKLANIVAHFEWTTRKIDINTWPGGMGAFRASVQAAQKVTDEDGWMMATTKNPYDGAVEDVAFVVGQQEKRIRDGLQAFLTSDAFLDAVAARVTRNLLAAPVGGVLTVKDDGTEERQDIEVSRALARGAEAPVGYRRQDTAQKRSGQ